MKHKILIAIDASENSLKAVKYAAGILRSDSQVTLFHVFYKFSREDIQITDLSPHHDVTFSGSTKEFKAWLAQQRASVEEALDRARAVLIEGGLDSKNIKVKIEESKQGVATDILNEIKEGGYDTVILGRRGVSGVKRFFFGSVTTKIMHHAEDCAVWVVE
jgi:nucleotide-binding universal stress UspA family protein